MPGYFPGPYHAGPYVRLILTGPMGAVIAAGPLVLLAALILRAAFYAPWFGATIALGLCLVFAANALATVRARRAADALENLYRDFDGIDQWIDSVGSSSGSRRPLRRSLSVRGASTSQPSAYIASLGGGLIGTLIPVLLALLLFFIAGAPRMQKAIDVLLLRKHVDPDAVHLAMDEHRKITVDSDSVPFARLPDRLRALHGEGRDSAVISCDDSLSYARVVSLIDAARGAGFSRIIVAPPGSSP